MACHEKFGPGKKVDPRSIYFLEKTGPPRQKSIRAKVMHARAHAHARLLAMAARSVVDIDMSLPDAAYLYLTEQRYPEGCSDDRKRAIRKKAGMFTIKEGVMFLKKKE